MIDTEFEQYVEEQIEEIKAEPIRKAIEEGLKIAKDWGRRIETMRPLVIGGPQCPCHTRYKK